MMMVFKDELGPPLAANFEQRLSSLHFGGAVAQLGERLVRNEEVRGSNPLGSTMFPPNSSGNLSSL